jgi:uncharacterized membrane protein
MHPARTLAPIGALAFSAVAPAGMPTFRLLAPVDNGDRAQAMGISNNGLYVVGWSRDSRRQRLATVWDSPRTPLALSDVPFFSPTACGVADTGQLVAGYSFSDAHAWIWSPDGITRVSDFPGMGRDVDPTGTFVVGQIQVLPDYNTRGFCYYMTGKLVELEPTVGDTHSFAVRIDPSGSYVVGTTARWLPEFETRACVWSNLGGRPERVLAPSNSRCEGLDIAAGGRIVVGLAYNAHGDSEAARWVDGALEIIVPSDGGASAKGVSGDGSVVVGFSTRHDNAFVWDKKHGARSLRQMLANAGYDMSAYEFDDATDISADGRRVVGYGHLSSDDGRAIAWEIVLDSECDADVNGDSVLDFFDYLDFFALYDAEDLRADFNGDQQIDAFDYLDFAAAFETGCD